MSVAGTADGFAGVFSFGHFFMGAAGNNRNNQQYADEKDKATF